MKKILITSLLSLSLFSSDQIDLNWLKKQPKSIAKDFYIWRYLNQDITPQEAKNALSMVKSFNNKIFYRYISKSNDELLKDYKKCIKLNTKELLNKKPYCIDAGLSVYDVTKLSKDEMKKLINKVENEYEQLSKNLLVLASPLPFETLQKVNNKTFFKVFNQVGSKYRLKHFNNYFLLSTLDRLSKDKKFEQSIKLIVTNLKMDKAQKSLLNIDSTNLRYQATLFLAINAIRHNKLYKAMKYLDDAYTKAYYQMQKDNITFWQYQLTNEKQYLDRLSSSWDLNIYSLYAHNKNNKKLSNVFYSIEQVKGDLKVKQNSFNTKYPFDWFPILKDIKKLNKEKMDKYEKLFNNTDTLGHLAFVKEKYSKYRNSYFITPYIEDMKSLPKDRVAMLYAIARQESRFIPTSISSAYAMGMMQIMPFLSKHIAKELKEVYDIDKQLNPKVNMRYGAHHIKFLEKRLSHPLFVAYAYNGGIGFTKRLLKTDLFKKGKYEPYLSMELLPYNETKKYGKKVLANYYIYQNYLNPDNKINFSTLMKINNKK
ncbi:MAG: lytic transglycosylase domain-containing protein [Campylobacterota bacterium]|nr:lytic transglycosylase domain-containing protein [Campylobacterota bacterium]